MKGKDGNASLMGGGVIDVYNPFGKVVVSVQSDKTSQGAVYVHDVNGKVTDVLR